MIQKKFQFEQQLRAKFFFLQALLWFVMLLLGGRLFYLQIVEGQDYRSVSANNYIRSIVLKSSRGLLLDRNGRNLCRNRVSFSLILDLSRGGRVEGILEEIRTELGLEVSPEEVRQSLKRSPVASMAVLARDIPLSLVERVEARQGRWPMLRIEMDLRREYPLGKTAAHAIGYVGLLSPEETEQFQIENADVFQEIGKAGVERAVNRILMGRNGRKRALVDNIGREVEIQGLQLRGVGVIEEPRPGKTLTLNLDLRLQELLEEAFGEECGAAVFMKPYTGEVLAWVSRPAYDPNLFSGSLSPADWQRLVRDPDYPLLNRPIQGVYPAGSTMKPFVALVGLEEGVLTADSAYFCPGYVEFGSHRFHCWNRGGHGTVGLIRAIENSCNVFFYRAGEQIGIDRLHAWAERMGLSGPSSVDLPGERAGTFPSPQWKKLSGLGPWFPGDTLSVSIGQGYVSVTPLQILSFYAAIGTEGRRFQPRLVKGTPELLSAVRMSPESLEILKEGLWQVVNGQGTATRLRIPGKDVCAKTGTAQVVLASAGKDPADLEKAQRDHAWVAGFAPMKRPEVAFVVLVEHGGHGGDISARIAKLGLDYVLSGRTPPEESEPDAEVEAGLQAFHQRGAAP